MTVLPTGYRFKADGTTPEGHDRYISTPGRQPAASAFFEERFGRAGIRIDLAGSTPTTKGWSVRRPDKERTLGFIFEHGGKTLIELHRHSPAEYGFMQAEDGVWHGGSLASALAFLQDEYGHDLVLAWEEWRTLRVWEARDETRRSRAKSPRRIATVIWNEAGQAHLRLTAD